MDHNPYAVEPRRKLTDKQRLQMFMEHKGICCLCGGKIDGVRESWTDEHIEPLWRNGTNDMANRAPAHMKCARGKSGQENIDRAKGRRVAEKHFGAKVSKNPMPGSRRSPWKKRIDGTVERRK